VDDVCAFAGTGDIGVAFDGFEVTFGVSVGDGDTAVGEREDYDVTATDVGVGEVFCVGGVVLFA
jgi:hypothetical protein